MDVKKNEHWLDKPIIACKSICKTSKTRCKAFKKHLSKNADTKSVNKLLDKADKLL